MHVEHTWYTSAAVAAGVVACGRVPKAFEETQRQLTFPAMELPTEVATWLTQNGVLHTSAWKEVAHSNKVSETLMIRSCLLLVALFSW